MAVTILKSGTIGSINVALSAAINGYMFPLTAQIDAMLALGLGPFEFDLALQFDAALALQATLSLQIGDPLAGIQLVLSALAQLQAALQVALALPPISLSLGAELTATAALAGTLAAKLGGLQAMISAALAIKIPAVNFAAQLAASLGLGPAFLISIDSTTLAAAGSEIGTLFSGGLNDPVEGNSIASDEGPVSGIILLTKNPAVGVAFNALFGTSF